MRSPFLIDILIAICSTSALIDLERWHVSESDVFLRHATFGTFSLECLILVALHSFLRMQWVCSTLEFQTYFRRAAFAKFLSSWISTPFFRAWTLVATLRLGCISIWWATVIFALVWFGEDCLEEETPEEYSLFFILMFSQDSRFPFLSCLLAFHCGSPFGSCGTSSETQFSR